MIAEMLSYYPPKDGAGSDPKIKAKKKSSVRRAPPRVVNLAHGHCLQRRLDGSKPDSVNKPGHQKGKERIGKINAAH
ncbi:hypothetical protein SDC9_90841 [bioreactor metagenome]|uniref:Uncharacterized protein n=1 Tax=bioreactor metagenome TaxID=1076179 RepID=A0A644ZZY2_9ZZZZ